MYCIHAVSVLSLFALFQHPNAGAVFIMVGLLKLKLTTH
jgi:hypothetical protein